MIASRRLLLQLLFFPFVGSLKPSVAPSNKTPAATAKTTIQICHNKDCCQRYEGSFDLMRTMQDLLPPSADVCIEVTSCLSQCEKGPNVCVQKDGKEISLSGVWNHACAAADLEVSCSMPPADSALLAAVSVMERSEKASGLDQKKKFLDSVIKTLNSKGKLSQSSAIIHAHCLRAQVHLEQEMYDLAKEDVHQASSIDPFKVLPTAWRILAEAEEASGNINGAMQALRQWAKYIPSFSTKVAKEMQRLQEL